MANPMDSITQIDGIQYVVEQKLPHDPTSRFPVPPGLSARLKLNEENRHHSTGAVMSRPRFTNSDDSTDSSELEHSHKSKHHHARRRRKHTSRRRPRSEVKPNYPASAPSAEHHSNTQHPHHSQHQHQHQHQHHDIQPETTSHYHKPVHQAQHERKVRRSKHPRQRRSPEHENSYQVQLQRSTHLSRERRSQDHYKHRSSDNHHDRRQRPQTENNHRVLSHLPTTPPSHSPHSKPRRSQLKSPASGSWDTLPGSTSTDDDHLPQYFSSTGFFNSNSSSASNRMAMKVRGPTLSAPQLTGAKYSIKANSTNSIPQSRTAPSVSSMSTMSLHTLGPLKRKNALSPEDFRRVFESIGGSNGQLRPVLNRRAASADVVAVHRFPSNSAVSTSSRTDEFQDGDEDEYKDFYVKCDEENMKIQHVEEEILGEVGSPIPRSELRSIVARSNRSRASRQSLSRSPPVVLPSSISPIERSPPLTRSHY